MPSRDHTRRLRRAAILTALTILLVVVPVAAASATPTQLTATVTPAAVVYPGHVAVAGTISVPGAALTLETRPAGSADAWSSAGAATADAAGAFSFDLKPSVSSDLRVSYAGLAPHDPASIDLQVVVRPRVTISVRREFWQGATVSLGGAVSPAQPGAAVTIERRVGGTWQSFAATTLDGASRFSLPWHPQDFGFFRLRARVAAGASYGSGASRPVLVTVDRPNRHDVPYRYAHYIVIVKHLFKLYYYEHGAMVRSFNVALGRPGYPTPLGLFRIRAKRRPGGGPMGSCVMYYYGSIAIHGTNQAYLLKRFPRNFSHGCARMYNDQALWLYRRCPVGTKVHNFR